LANDIIRNYISLSLRHPKVADTMFRAVSLIAAIYDSIFLRDHIFQIKVVGCGSTERGDRRSPKRGRSESTLRPWYLRPLTLEKAIINIITIDPARCIW